MKNKKLLLALLAVVLVLSATIGTALAYFTAYTTAQGKKTLSLVPHTRIDEPVVREDRKEVVVTNTGNAPCFVRVKAFAGGGVKMSVTAGNGWTGGDGSDYWNYTPMLEPGESTATLVINLSDLPAEATEFNIAVVYESTPALWDDANGEYYADWSQGVQTGGQNP